MVYTLGSLSKLHLQPTRPLTTNYRQLRIEDVKPRLDPGQQHYGKLNISWSRCNYGGAGRPWLHCPKCDRRVGILYEVERRHETNLLRCRHCIKAVHPSTRENARDRWHRKVREFRRKTGYLDWYPPSAPVNWAAIPKPWAMRRKTWEAILLDMQLEEVRYWGYVAGKLTRSYSRLNRILG